MNQNNNLPARGLLHLADSKVKEKMEDEIDLALTDVYESADLVRDNARELERVLSTLLYGTEVQSFPARMITRRW